MSRKIERSMWRDGNRRRSPRITAMDSCKESHETPCNSGCMLHQEDCGDCKGPPSQKRTRNKRKLEKAESDAVSIETKQGGDSQHHKDYSTSCGKSIQLPGKRILEPILDTLQRRDINEIFAEPVHPSEVEDYYKIVKEPMDFGTMRAKLHEGMYQNIEQFEHDVFLIPTNAMHFNSRGSTRFRQARAIYELAKKIFHVLRSDPENIEVEFSGARRRSIRKAMGETKASRQSFDPVTGSVKKDISSKGIRSLSGPSVLKRSKGRQVINYYDFYPDARKNRRPQSVEADRRCTCRPRRSPFDNNNNTSVDSTIYSNSRPILINQQDISYKESLMLFVKDLGPTAQIIAKKKLKGWLKNSATCQAPSSNYSIQALRRQASTAFETAYQRFPDSLPGCHSIFKTSSGTRVI